MFLGFVFWNWGGGGGFNIEVNIRKGMGRAGGQKERHGLHWTPMSHKTSQSEQDAQKLQATFLAEARSQIKSDRVECHECLEASKADSSGKAEAAREVAEATALEVAEA